MPNNKLARPYFQKEDGFRVPLDLAARRSLNKHHTGGTWHYTEHTVGGITRKSHYLTGETWVINKAIIYRVRRGNGYYGSIYRKRYQDQFPYFIPSSINNWKGQTARDLFAKAVLNWQTIVSEAEKIAYNKRATKGLHMSGYNLYIREYIKKEYVAMAYDYIKVSDVKPQGTNGGSFTAGAWRTRDINTEDIDTGGHCSIANNQITLAAGTYECFIACPSHMAGENKARLYNVTDGAVVLLGQNTQTSSIATVVGRFTIAAQKTFEIQHQCSSTEANYGFGHNNDFDGANEVYTVAEFRKVA